MKKTFKVLLLSVIAIFFVIPVFSQVDSTTVVNVVKGYEVNHTWVVTVVAIVAIVSEILALIPSKYLPSNGIVDTIVKLLRWIGSAK